MKKDPHAHAGPRADQDTVRSARPLPFRIANFEACSYGAKRATFAIVIDGLGAIDCDLFVPDNGRSPFAIGRSVKSRFTGAYERVIHLEQPFADVLVAEAIKLLASESGDER